MSESGIDVLLIYGNAWQSDYLRYTTDYSILEGQALALVRADGHVTLYLDSPLEVDRAALDCPALDIVHAPQLLGEVDRALDRFRNQRIGAAPWHLLPRRIAARAKDLSLADQTGFLDRLLMHKLPSEIAAMRRAARLADDGYDVFRQAARPGRADYELIAEIEAFFRANGVHHNFQIIGVGGPEVRGMAPPSGKRLKRGDLVTTELTPCVDGYYAQICRTLVVGSANAEQQAAHALWRESMEAGIAVVRWGHCRRHRARRTDVFRHHGLGEYTTSEYTARPRARAVRRHQAAHPRRRHHPHDAGMTLIVHPNTYHPLVGYLVLGDTIIVTNDGCEVLTATPRDLFSVAA
jgi:Xaa-Pro aminopeptidase